MNYIGIDIGGTNLKAGLTDENGRLLAVKSMKIREVSDPDVLADTLVTLTEELAAQGGIAVQDIASVGAGIPGVVDIRTGSIVYTCNLPLRNIPLRKLFKRRLGLRLYVENDANCAALAEYYAGAGQGSKRFVTITLGTGIGGGLVVGGKLYTGFAQSGLEVGHMIIRPNGVLCGCGNRGCWEQYGSATALIRIAQEAMERDPGSVMWELCQGDRFRVDGRIPFQAARLGDLSAKKVLHRYLEGLSIGLINLVNILQPEIICLGGGISNAEDDLLLDPLRGLVLAGCFDKSKPPRLERASLGNDAGVVGAAMLYKML